jgi:DNA-binding MarR family transcriptional regulator
MNLQLASAAIEDYDVYTVAQRLVLKAIVSTSINGTSNVSATYLQGIAKISRPTVYLILNRLEKDGYISRMRAESSRQNSYKVNEQNIEYIIQLYNSKKSISSYGKI